MTKPKASPPPAKSKAETRTTRSINPTISQSATLDRAVALVPGRTFSGFVIDVAHRAARRELAKAKRATELAAVAAANAPAFIAAGGLP